MGEILSVQLYGVAICFVAGVCLILKQGHRSRALIAFARSLGRAVWISFAVSSFWDEQLGWTSMSAYRPTAPFLSMCVMDGLVPAQEDTKKKKKKKKKKVPGFKPPL